MLPWSRPFKLRTVPLAPGISAFQFPFGAGDFGLLPLSTTLPHTIDILPHLHSQCKYFFRFPESFFAGFSASSPHPAGPSDAVGRQPCCACATCPGETYGGGYVAPNRGHEAPAAGRAAIDQENPTRSGIANLISHFGLDVMHSPYARICVQARFRAHGSLLTQK